VLDWYSCHGTPVVRIDAMGSVDDVTERAVRAISL